MQVNAPQYGHKRDPMHQQQRAPKKGPSYREEVGETFEEKRVYSRLYGDVRKKGYFNEKLVFILLPTVDDQVRFEKAREQKPMHETKKDKRRIEREARNLLLYQQEQEQIAAKQAAAAAQERARQEIIQAALHPGGAGVFVPPKEVIETPSVRTNDPTQICPKGASGGGNGKQCTPTNPKSIAKRERRLQAAQARKKKRA